MIAGAGHPFEGRHGHVGGHLGGFGGGGPIPNSNEAVRPVLLPVGTRPVPSKSASQKKGILSMHNLY